MEVVASPRVGQTAPEFALKGPGGQVIRLSDYVGDRNVVLVFYPLAFSPVCSHQLPLIQKELERFRRLDAEVLGISVDSHYANTAFARELGVTFPLLSDFRHQASLAYGVLNPETLYSRRAVFVIDKQGRIVHVDESPVGSGIDQIPRVDAMLEALSKMA